VHPEKKNQDYDGQEKEQEENKREEANQEPKGSPLVGK
jgi:hypothetical protein